jgi:hypothetical protein
VALDDIRLDLVTSVFELAGAGRSFVAAGDTAGAISSMSRVAWLELWERAVGAAAVRVREATNTALAGAASVSRFPRRRLERLLLSAEDGRAIAARLGSGGAGFVAALDALEQTARQASAAGERGKAAWREWQAALSAAARRLESAWLSLEQSARTEQDRWAREVTRVAAWHRPAWPLWLITLAVAAVATYLGLVLGGYLTVPAPLRGLAKLWWSW